MLPSRRGMAPVKKSGGVATALNMIDEMTHSEETSGMAPVPRVTI